MDLHWGDLKPGWGRFPAIAVRESPTFPICLLYNPVQRFARQLSAQYGSAGIEAFFLESFRVHKSDAVSIAATVDAVIDKLKGYGQRVRDRYRQRVECVQGRTSGLSGRGER